MFSLFYHHLVNNILYRFIDESPRWLISQGKYEKADKIIRKIAAINQKDIPDNLKLDEMPKTEENVWTFIFKLILLYYSNNCS